MRLFVAREPTIDGVTLGSLYLNGERFCDCLEDAIREVPGVPVEAWKIKGETAIPAGRYDVRMSYSHRFKRILPEVLQVPGFVGIRIHAGNSIEDTEGCLLVGSGRNGHMVTSSRVALEKLMLRMAEAKGPMTIEYRNPELFEVS